MKKGQIQGIFLTIMIVVIIAMVALQVSWGLIREQVDTTAIGVDQFTASNGTCTRVTDLCIVRSSTSAIRNSTGSGINLVGNFTECGTGNDLFGYDMVAGADNNLTGGLMNSTYTEESCTPLTGITATIITYIPLLMAVVILVFVGAFAMKGA